MPAVRVWDLSDNNNQVAEYLGHKFSVACVVGVLLYIPSDDH